MHYVPGKVATGRSGLVHLAVHILSVIANSAGSERTFSDFGVIHTKRRNRQGPQKVHKTTLVRSDIHRENAAAGLTSGRLKRSFGPGTLPTHNHGNATQGKPGSVSEISDDNIDEDVDFREIGRELMNDAFQSTIEPPNPDEDEGPEASTCAAPPQTGANTPAPSASRSQGSRSSVHSRTQTCIPLEKLFAYPDPSQPADTLEFFWHGGIRNLEEEKAMYSLIHELLTPTASSTAN